MVIQHNYDWFPRPQLMLKLLKPNADDMDKYDNALRPKRINPHCQITLQFYNVYEHSSKQTGLLYMYTDVSIVLQTKKKSMNLLVIIPTHHSGSYKYEYPPTPVKKNGLKI